MEDQKNEELIHQTDTSSWANDQAPNVGLDYWELLAEMRLY